MALSHTILAALENNALSGYELWKKFTQCTNHSWKASQQQIYRELTKLEARSAITSEIISQEGRPDKKPYRITAIGKEILTTWIAEPSQPMAVRKEILVKVSAAHLLPFEVIISELKRHYQIHSQNLATCQEKEMKFLVKSSELSVEEKCKYLTLRWGIRYERECVAWCIEAIAMLNK